MLRFILTIAFGSLGIALAMNLGRFQTETRQVLFRLIDRQFPPLGDMGDLFVYGYLLPLFIAISLVSTLILRSLAYWTTAIAISFPVVQSYFILNPRYQWENTTFASSISDVFICFCAIPMSFATINVVSTFRRTANLPLSTRGILTATLFIAMLCGSIVIRSELLFSLVLLIFSTWIAFETTPRHDKDCRSSHSDQDLKAPNGLL